MSRNTSKNDDNNEEPADECCLNCGAPCRDPYCDFCLHQDKDKIIDRHWNGRTFEEEVERRSLEE